MAYLANLFGVAQLNVSLAHHALRELRKEPGNVRVASGEPVLERRQVDLGLNLVDADGSVAQGIAGLLQRTVVPSMLTPLAIRIVGPGNVCFRPKADIRRNNGCSCAKIRFRAAAVPVCIEPDPLEKSVEIRIRPEIAHWRLEQGGGLAILIASGRRQ